MATIDERGRDERLMRQASARDAEADERIDRYRKLVDRRRELQAELKGTMGMLFEEFFDFLTNFP